MSRPVFKKLAQTTQSDQLEKKLVI